MIENSLFSRLPKGRSGEQELDQIIVTLFSHFLRSLNLNPEIAKLGAGVWFGSQTLCVSQHSLASLDPNAFKETLARNVRGVIVVATPLDSLGVTGIQKIIQRMLQQSGWHNKASEIPVRVLGEQALVESLSSLPLLCLRYFPELIPDGQARLEKIHSTRSLYDQEFIKLNSEIQFVGMSVYKEEASAGIEMERIYIPLRVVPEGTADEALSTVYTNPLSLLGRGSRHVILGDPGSGKSTLLRFLALAGIKHQLLEKYGGRKDKRLPILITLRRYAESLQSQKSLDLLDYVTQTASSDMGIPLLDRDFFEYALYSGQGLIFLDGIDELPDPDLKLKVRNKVEELLQKYPENTLVVTSRIVGYDKEARFDRLGFSHYRVAKLTLKNIEKFVEDWYRARISNKPERERHAGDLIRILQDPDGRAIRELAENPLLLTIVCLVHRIDAELPDERVILYQKCTETLLNTWHNWKFRGERENLQSRNKIERRNRSRMEAIAYWLHASLKDDPKQIRRAVVPYEALRNFLTEYIQDTEKPRGEDPAEMAETFLRFVKERAGLLIEVGGDQYSFVHLTFQEYLTATHLRKSGETAGITVIWPYVERHCGDPRWHEPIRLLVGSLEKIDSQRYLLKQLLPAGYAPAAFERTVVAGGCLLDSVDAAEEMQDEILSALLFQASTVESLDLFRQVVRLVRTWTERDAQREEELSRLAKRIAEKIRGTDQEIYLALTLVSLGWGNKRILEITTCLEDASYKECRAFSNLCGSNSSAPQWLDSESSAIHNFLILASLESPGLNFVATTLGPLLLSQPFPRFTQLLACIGLSGPFEQTVFNCAAIRGAFESPFDRMRTRTGARTRARSLARALAQDLDRERSLERSLKRFLDHGRGGFPAISLSRSLGLALKMAWDRLTPGTRSFSEALGQNRDRTEALGRAQVLAWDQSRARTLAQNQARTRDRSRIRTRAARKLDDREFGPPIISERDFYKPLLEVLCEILFSPRPQWYEALRLRALPHIPQRMSLVDPQLWKSTHQAFRQHNAGTVDCEHAASQLLLEVWLWSAHSNYHLQSYFQELAKLTRAIDSPPLRIAHCIRDIARGDKTRLRDFRMMLYSENSAYRKIFEDAFWR